MTWRGAGRLLRITLHLALALSAAAMAAQADVVTACRDRSLPPPAAPARELLVAIDQTTPLNPPLRQQVADNLKPFLAADSSFTIIVFSAYAQGHYTEVLASARVDAPLAPALRADVPGRVLAQLDQCAQRQLQQAAQLADQALRQAWQGASGASARSDVLASLKVIAAIIKKSPARDKVILVVSDMLENSPVASFYADQGRSVRHIDAAQELDAVRSKRLLADFGGARLYVIGAGLLPGDAQQTDPRTMQALADFWSAYADKSHAQMVEFGQPALRNPVH